MVERGDRVTMNEEYVENLLKSYKERMITAKVMEKEDEEIEFLDKCLDCLEGDGKTLLRAMYIDGYSSRRCALSCGLTRYYVETECKRLLSLLARLFEKRFAQAPLSAR